MHFLHLSSSTLDELFRVLIPLLVAVLAYLKADRQKKRLLRHQAECKPRTCGRCIYCPLSTPDEESKPSG